MQRLRFVVPVLFVPVLFVVGCCEEDDESFKQDQVYYQQQVQQVPVYEGEQPSYRHDGAHHRRDNDEPQPVTIDAPPPANHEQQHEQKDERPSRGAAEKVDRVLPRNDEPRPAAEVRRIEPHHEEVRQEQPARANSSSSPNAPTQVIARPCKPGTPNCNPK